MANPRQRETDPEDSDKWKDRNTSPDSHTRWFVGIGSAAIVTALGWFIINDRNSVERRLKSVEDLATLTRQTQIEVMTKADVRFDETQRRLDTFERNMKESLDRIEKEVKEIGKR